MGSFDNRRRVACLALPTTHTSALYGGFDILSTAGVSFDVATAIISGERRLAPLIAAPTGDAVLGWNDLPIQPSCGIADTGPVDAIYVPPLGEVDADPPRPDDAVLDWIAENYRKGAMITAACSGTYVLAEAGILSGERATTHWAWAKI